MTVLKRFWPNHKLKKIVNRWKNASQKRDQKDFFKIFTVLINNNSPQGPVNLIEHLKFSLDMVLNFACLHFARSFFREY